MEPAPTSPARPKRSKRGRILLVVALLVLGGGIYLLLHRGEQSTDDAAIEASIVPLAPKVAGYIVKLNVADNQTVAAGDIIAEIDPRDYEIALQKAQADLASAEARLSGGGHSLASTKVTAPMNVSSAQAQVAAAQANLDRARLELNRMKKLGDAARSRQQLEQATANEKAATSALADAQARLQSARTAPNTVATAAASVKDLEAAVSTQKALVAQAQKNLDDTKIITPIAGRISRRNVELGSYVQSGQQLLSLVATDYWVIANYKETQLTNIKPGQKVVVEIDAYPDKRYKAHVDSVQLGTGARFSIFPPENATGNFVKIVQRVPVKIVFDEKPDAALAIGPGMSVRPVVYTGTSTNPSLAKERAAMDTEKTSVQ